MEAVVSVRTCRLCDATLTRSVIDLGHQPFANDLRPTAEAARQAPKLPLHALVCEACWLVQLAETAAPDDLFADYPYQSSYSTSWLEHVESFAAWAHDALGIDAGASVVEIGSNDGCLLERFVARGATVVGVDPAGNLSDVAAARGVPTIVDFFGHDVAVRMVEDGIRPDLVVANNVFAHVPDVRDFVAGLGVLADAGATVSIEVPHLLSLVDGLAFDTVYHEHVSYFSLASASRALATAGLEVVDVHLVPTHGGSMRLLVRSEGAAAVSDAVGRLAAEESARGVESAGLYEDVAARVTGCTAGLRAFLDDARTRGDLVLGYGAAAKATVLLNAVGATTDDVGAVADRNPLKVGRYVPGVGVPIIDDAEIARRRPRYVLVFPWNIEHELARQLADVTGWGGELVVAVPQMRTIVATTP